MSDYWSDDEPRQFGLGTQFIMTERRRETKPRLVPGFVRPGCKERYRVSAPSRRT